MGKRSAPKGNQNARKHGFYSRALTETEKLRIKDAQIKAINIITRLVKTRRVVPLT